MHKFFFSGTLILIFSVSLGLLSCDEQTRGNGVIVTESRNLASFTNIVSKTSGEIVLRKSTESSIVISAESNIIGLISTEVNANTLTIDVTESISTREGMTFVISSPSFKEIESQGSANIRSENDLDEELIKVTAKGSGRIKLKGKAIKQNIVIDGSGDVDHFDFLSDEVDINISGSGNVEVVANETLDVRINGSGNVFYKGNPAVSTNIAGSGDVIDAN